ncbi:CBS domain-containing protein [Silvibacterium acidisoli]|uniref:CBS domain-containing protein n=1 Tax=Acidobacteriaceae bacterium ZG23-2 TaxID=2883246 RepID=UPI00406CCC2C
MRGWSLPLGRWFGIDLRIHTFFFLLLGFCLLTANVDGLGAWRGIIMWGLLLLAVFVRELARLIAAAYHGLQLRSILLLPIGGLFSYSTPESAERAVEGNTQRALALAGPLANVAFAAVVAALIAGASSAVPLSAHPLVTPHHLIRSTVWFSLMLAALHCLPAYPLDAGRLLRAYFSQTRGSAQATRAVSGISQGFGLLVMLAGLALLAVPGNGTASGLTPWLIMGGFFIFVGAQLEDQGVMFQSVVETVRMKDVMLTEFSTLSPSDTLSDALYRAIHSLQDEFPVVRGGNLVGVVSKQSILAALRNSGNGYVQSVMVRTFQVAAPDDSLGLMIRRIAGGRMALVPVAVEGRIVGIVTWQNLSNSMGLLAEHRRFEREN